MPLYAMQSVILITFQCNVHFEGTGCRRIRPADIGNTYSEPQSTTRQGNIIEYLTVARQPAFRK
jgi:hypothetical protein